MFFIGRELNLFISNIMGIKVEMNRFFKRFFFIRERHIECVQI